MNRTLKTLLLWLLMAVLPLNAVAAAVGVSCKAVHGQQTSAHPAGHQQGGQAAAAGHSGHESGAHAAASAPLDDADSKFNHSTCSACSAFCIGAFAPPPSAVPSQSPTGSESVLITPAPWVAGFIPDGQKRPPRQLPA